MNQVNADSIPETEWKSPAGKYHQFYRGISEALGRDPQSLDLAKRHPFDLEFVRLPPGATNSPFHSHSAQWEMYLIVSGRCLVRDDTGQTEVGPGDSFLFRPGEAHQLSNPGPEDLLYYVIADNPIGDACHYPDSNKWLLSRGSGRVVVRGQETTYLEGEE
jgi:uncharacterized cupin superfamily protein